jgi:hypothetical protein
MVFNRGRQQGEGKKSAVSPYRLRASLCNGIPLELYLSGGDNFKLCAVIYYVLTAFTAALPSGLFGTVMIGN